MGKYIIKRQCFNESYTTFIKQILAEDNIYYIATNNAKIFDSVLQAQLFYMKNWDIVKPQCGMTSLPHIEGPKKGIYSIWPKDRNLWE